LRFLQRFLRGWDIFVDERGRFRDARALIRPHLNPPPTPLLTSPTSTDKVAIKKIEPMCEDIWDAKHTLRELRLMRLLDYHPNVISLVSLSSTATSLYIVMELMDSDLHKIVQSKQKLGEPHLKVIWTQILSGVRAMHSNNVYHRDLKPGNILVSRDCQVRITDFGLARSISQSDDIDSSNPASAMTEYVVTRWYR